MGMGALILGATGVVFGDIGTSPLYALKETFHRSGTELSDIYGVVSLVFWSLMLVVSFKYLSFVMRADNKGEGGILALLSLLPAKYRQASTKSQNLILLTVLIGTALLFGDGVLTPAISVLSATEGLALVNESMASASVPLTVVILIALFAVQSKGTHKIGQVFGPIMIAWFLLLGGLGIYRFIGAPEVIEALSPAHAVGYVVENGFSALLMLSSVILAVTGAEALYADMGHFGRKPIQRAWWFIVGPALVLNYLGQAAVVVQNPEAAHNPFFSLAPNDSFVLFMVLMATAATVIASQALITGVFSLSRQAVQLGLFPRLRITHTSAAHEGQIYVPLVNWAVGFFSILLVVAFQSSSALAHAYVLAIAGTMAITTLAFHMVAKEVWHWSALRLYPLTTIFLIVDLAFLIGTSVNIVHGGWVPVALGAMVLAVMILWRRGYQALGEYINSRRLEWPALIREIEHGSLTRVPGIGVYLSAPTEEVPASLISQSKMLRSIPADVYVVTVSTVPEPTVDEAPGVVEIGPRIKRVNIPVGYMDSVDIPAVIKAHVLGETEAVATYYLSDRRFIGTDANRVGKTSEKMFDFLHRNSATVTEYFNLPPDRVIAMGVRIDL
jgi:KUP system potassium uptake protein